MGLLDETHSPGSLFNYHLRNHDPSHNFEVTETLRQTLSQLSRGRRRTSEIDPTNPSFQIRPEKDLCYSTVTTVDGCKLQ
jgi:hypothetical protein